MENATGHKPYRDLNERQKYLHHGSFLKYVVIYKLQINPENIGVWMEKNHWENKRIEIRN